MGLSKRFLPGEGTMVPVDEADEDESLNGDSMGRVDGSSSSSSPSLNIGGSRGSLVRSALAKER